jgi:murein L,D-transpeptidase YcbB/YkuD
MIESSGQRPFAGLAALLLGLAGFCSVAVADQAAAEPASLPRLVVGARQVRALENGLRRYEVILARGGWLQVPGGPTIRPGASGPRVAALAERLSVTGDAPVRVRAESAIVYEPQLQAAVRRFQFRHGLEADGLVGRRTLAALNVSAVDRVEEIKASLERARRARVPGDGLGVVVNIPAYHATLLNDGREAWSARVIVGSESTPTPELSGLITEVVLNPAWSVPVEIAAREILPILRASPAAAARSGYVVYTADGTAVGPNGIDWEDPSSAASALRIVQRPGPLNELGPVKFVFPNIDDIYLHGTPSTDLFRRSVRALSHGCIRLQDPVRLAMAILARQGWSRADIDEQLATGKTLAILLQSPVPIDVRYQTVLADDVGALFFFEDIYRMSTKPFGRVDPNEAASECNPQ